MSAPGAPPSSVVFAEPRPVEALGDLFANIWQLCYVTEDLERGMELMGERLGIENFTEVPIGGATFLKGGEPVHWEARVAMGARGGPIIELIEPVAGEIDFYRRFLPEDRSEGVGFHHLAVLVPPGEVAWESVQEVLTRSGLGFEYTITIPDRARLAYVDTTAWLGHFLELCQLQPADIDFFSGLVDGTG
jgi:hypothetical protein